MDWDEWVDLDDHILYFDGEPAAVGRWRITNAPGRKGMRAVSLHDDGYVRIMSHGPLGPGANDIVGFWLTAGEASELADVLKQAADEAGCHAINGRCN